MIEAWLSDLADGFWQAAGGAPAPPRDLIDCVPLALPVTIVTLPALGFARAKAWLARHGADVDFGACDQRLHGCLVARAGHGVIFLDGADAPDERRFTLAHEVAHFLVDYRQPRERAVRLLGAGIASVLDGLRSPTSEERLHAGLTACPLGLHVHHLAREGDRGAAASAVELRVDRLTWELLAPTALVCEAIARLSDEAGEQILREQFGLPMSEAERYVQFLRRAHGPGPSFVDWLRS